MGGKKRGKDDTTRVQKIQEPSVRSTHDQNIDMLVDWQMLESLGVETDDLHDYPLAQLDEMVVLASTYGFAPGAMFKRASGTKHAWRDRETLCWVVTITSSHNSDFSARLKFSYPYDYPKVPLVATLVEFSPAQDKKVQAQILSILKSIPPRTQTGYDTIHYESAFTITDAVTEQLDVAAIDYENALRGKSLAVMREEDEAMQHAHLEAERERQVQLKEAQLLAEEERLKRSLHLEKKRRHNASSVGQSEVEDDADEEEFVRGIPFRFHDKVIMKHPRPGTPPWFRAVFGPHIMLKRRDKTVTLVGPVKFGKSCDGAMLLKEIFIPDRIAPERGQLEDAMDEVRQTLEDCRNSPHANIVDIFAFQIDHDDEDQDMPEYKISVLSDFTFKGSVADGMKFYNGFRGGTVRNIGIQALRALEWIEAQGHTHPALHPANVMAFLDPQGVVQFKLADGYGTTLRNLVRKAREANGTALPDITGWTAPELVANADARSNKTCMWEFGVLLVKIAFIDGADVERVLTSPSKLLWRDDLDPTFIDLLQNVFQEAARRRPSPFDLISHQFFKDGKKDINIPTPENPGPVPHLLRSGFAAEAMGSVWSKKWIVACKLGEGGFGQVVKARNVDDGQFYAVKSVLCETSKDLEEIWAEVKLLAKLNHPGVVRYYNAWDEKELDEEDYEKQIRLRRESTPGRPARNSLMNDEPFSTGHDFMDPSLHRAVGPEYDTEDEDDNPFGYQSAPSDSEEDEDAADDGDPVFQGEPVFDSFSDNQGTSPEDQSMIQFGGEESSLEPIPKAASSMNPSSPNPNHRRSFAHQKSKLYIQMELCETATLSDRIKQGLPHRMDEVWRLLRQILDALAHIHDFGIVHRDLKPSNIFLERGNIKIGDFGLAVTGRTSGGLQGRNAIRGTLTAGVSSRGVGTKYYTAPELESSGSGRYSTKADMFSLGVIFFQMCFPMETLTEKISNLRKISEDSEFKLPSYFDERGYEKQARIIRGLISHNQDQRPGARELLEGDYLPEIIERDMIGRHIARMAKETPDDYKSLVEDIYKGSETFTKAQELAYIRSGSKGGVRNRRLSEPLVSGCVQDGIKEVFRQRGAIDSNREMEFPARSFYHNAATTMDEDGIRVQLPYDLTTPFAIMLGEPGEWDLAEEGADRPDYCKYYCFGTVYRSGKRGSTPLRAPEIDFDLVSYKANDLSYKDAEVIEVLDAVMLSQPALSARPLTIFINHGDLLDLILEFCKIPTDRWNDIKRHLSFMHVSATGWKEVRMTLLAHGSELSESSVSSLGAFKLHGTFDEVRMHLNHTFDEEYRSRAVRPLARLEEIFRLAKRLGISTKILLSPLSNQSEMLYRGSVMFQCVDTRARSILASGGRYDKLIEHYQQPGKQKGITRAAGFRINSKALYEHAYALYKSRASTRSKTTSKDLVSLRPPRVEAVVTSFDESTLRGPCVKIVKDLRANGIRAEVSEHYASMEELDAAYGEPINYCLVIVRPGASDKRPLKLRIPTREEKEVSVIDLSSTIRAELGGQAQAVSLEQPKLRKMNSTHGDGMSRPPILIAPKHRNKKVNRAAVTDAVIGASKQLIETLSNSAPVLTFGPKSDEVLQDMRNTRLTDGESWRTFRQMQPPTERGYLQEVQEELTKLAEQGDDGAFIVNYLTNSCIYYDFGKRS